VIKPYAILELGRSNRRKGLSHFIEATGLFDWQLPKDFELISGLRMRYFGNRKGAISALEFKMDLESLSQSSPWTNSTTGRVQVEAKYTWNYISTKKKARNIELRGYWGKVGVLSDGRNPGRRAQTENMYLMLSGASGQQDVFYDEYFRGRNSAPTFANNSWMGQYDFTTNGQQRMNNMGGMGTATFMGSNTSLMAVNFSMSLPKLPGFIRVFADYATMPNTVIPTLPVGLSFPTKFFDAGLMIRTGFLQVSVPLFMNNDLQKSLGGMEFVGEYVLPTYKQQLQRGIRFSLNIPLNSGLFLRKSLLPSI
jgi:hypothetical protein